MAQTRHRRRRYAQGRNAVAECMRSGQKMRYRDLVEDGQIPGLLVHPDWYEPRHPQEIPVDASDAIVLWSPSPEISVNTGEFDTLPEWEAWVITNCPAEPQNLRFFENTTLAEDAEIGSLTFPLEDAVVFAIGLCLYVELDGGGWFISQTSMGSGTTPSFTVGSILPFPTGQAASAGNQVFIGSGNNNVPLLNGAWTVT